MTGMLRMTSTALQLEPGAAANLGHGPRISTADSPVSVWVIPRTRNRALTAALKDGTRRSMTVDGGAR